MNRMASRSTIAIVLLAFQISFIQSPNALSESTVSNNNATCLKINFRKNTTSKFYQKDNLETRSSSFLELTAGQNYLTNYQTDNAEKYFFYDKDEKEKDQKYNFVQYTYSMIMSKLVGLAYNDYFIHQYDSYNDLRNSNPAENNQEICIKQLTELSERADAVEQAALQSTDIEFLRLMASFGRLPSGALVGDIFWAGSYDSCQRLSINYHRNNQSSENRYCVASLRLSGWDELTRNEVERIAAIKTAVCLPKACDAQSHKDKYQLIQKLIEFNVPQLQRYQAKLSSIYCLPHEESPLRAWSQSKPTSIVVICFLIWILFLLYATLKDELIERQIRKNQAITDGYRWIKLYKSLSITSNLKSLFKVDHHGGENAIEIVKKKKIVNLDMIDGIKVLAACYIITGHVIMVATLIGKDGQELAEAPSISFRLSNLMPAFAVNAFFVITGIITAYLIFKQNQSQSIITKPFKWIAIILYRYLRIMPMYVIVTLFCKHIARYIGDGPFWDYGTSSLAARRNCEQEPWAWTLLFGANFKSPLRHCIPSAWYLANDFQFAIITPIFVAALYLRPNLGKKLIITSIVAGYIAGFWNILSSAAYNLKPIALFMPHGFMTYVTFLLDNYTRPQYRIPAYLAGLLLGHILYTYERRRQAYLDQQQQLQQQQQEHVQQVEDEASNLNNGRRFDADKINGQELIDETDWSQNLFIQNGARLLTLAASSVILTPTIGSRLPLDKSSSKAAVAFIMPTFHLMYAFSIGNYILSATTGHGNKFFNRLLSMKFLKPLARLSLCVVLVNVEVISYIVQTNRRLLVLTDQYHTCLNLLCIIATYLVSIVACILFEAPLRGALNHLMAALMRTKSVNVTKHKKNDQ